MNEKDVSKNLSQIAETLLGKETLESLFNTITQAACSFFSASAASIMLFDPDREYLTIVSAHNLSRDYLKVVKVHKDEEIAGRVCHDKVPRFVSNVWKWFSEHGDNFTAEWAKKERLISTVCAPLLTEDEAIGCLNIYYRYPRDTFEELNALGFFTKLAARSIEHHQLMRESKITAGMLSMLSNIGLLITSSFNINEIIKVLLSTAKNITNTDVSGILLIDAAEMRCLEAYEYTSKDEAPRKYKSTARLSGGFSGEILQTKRPVVISDVSKHPNINPVSIDKGRVATAGIPLIAKNNVIGILYVDSLSMRNFSEAEINYLSILSNYASVAIENSRLYQAISREAEHASILYDVGKSFISTLDFDQLLNNILQRLTDTFGHLNLAIFLVDDELKELKLRAYINYSEDVKNFRLKIGESGIVGHVAASREMYYAPDVSKDPHYIKGVKMAQSEVCFPLIMADKLIGVLDVESPELDRFRPDDIHLLSLISTQIAIALENSRLYEKTKILSLTDPLTMLPNRRSLDLFIDGEKKRAERYKRSFALLMIDFDNFKNYNDRYGHTAGDEVLKNLGKLMRSTIRDVDFLGRYGGDEFVAVLSETSEVLASEVAERMRQKIATEKSDPHVTLSIGIAVFPEDANEIKSLIELADQACFAAKQLGGNRANPISRKNT